MAYLWREKRKKILALFRSPKILLMTVEKEKWKNLIIESCENTKYGKLLVEKKVQKGHKVAQKGGSSRTRFLNASSKLPLRRRIVGPSTNSALSIGTTEHVGTMSYFMRILVKISFISIMQNRSPL